MLGHEKIKPVMMRILKLLLHQFLLTYSTEKGSTHLQKISRVVVPPLRAVVTPPSTSAIASLTPTPTLQGLNLEPILEQEEAEGPKEEQEAVEHLRLRQTIQRDHPIDNILGSI
jgi:hypothetical protein